MKKTEKVIALILIIAFLSGTLFSEEYIIQNTHHDCYGEHCQICVLIKEAVQFISGIKIIPLLSFCMAVLCVFTLGAAAMKKHVSIKNTLITLKVELLD